MNGDLQNNGVVRFLRYCVQGLAPSGITFGVAYGITFGQWFVLLALIILVPALGFVNTVMAEILWKYDLDIGLWTFYRHGRYLAIVILIASVPYLAVNYLAPSIWTWLFVILLYLPSNGYLAKMIASEYQIAQYDEPSVDWD